MNECAYCGASNIDDHDPKTVLGEEAWVQLAEQHRDDCEWIDTRAFTRDGEPRREEYTVVADLTDGRWLDAEYAAQVEQILAEDGWTVTIRNPRKGECEGTYLHTSNGMQLLGYSVPGPEALTCTIEDAVNKAHNTPRA